MSDTKEQTLLRQKTTQVVSGFFQKLWRFQEQPYCHVTSVAKKFSHHSRFMVVVYLKAADAISFVVQYGFRFFAYFAKAMLSCKHLVVLSGRQSKDFQVSLSSSFSHASAVFLKFFWRHSQFFKATFFGNEMPNFLISLNSLETIFLFNFRRLS